MGIERPEVRTVVGVPPVISTQPRKEPSTTPKVEVVGLMLDCGSILPLPHLQGG